MKEFPKVAFASINSKCDWSQIQFYNAVALQNLLPADMSEESFLSTINLILERYNENRNFVSYLTTANDDGYLPKPLLYDTGTSGPTRRQEEGVDGKPMLVDWLANFTVPHRSVTSQCSGELLAKGQWHGTAYCDVAQKEKVFAFGGSRRSTPSAAATSTTIAAAEATTPVLAVDIQAGPSWASWYYCGLGIIAVALCGGAAVESYQLHARGNEDRKDLLVTQRSSEEFELLKEDQRRAENT